MYSDVYRLFSRPCRLDLAGKRMRRILPTAAVVVCIFIFPVFAFADSNKVYIGIPGDKMDTEGIIQKLLIPKKMEIDAIEKKNKDLKIESDIVKDFSLYLRELEAKSKLLYSFESPFGDMLGISTDPSVLDANATRKAKKQNYKLHVIRTAKPDSFMSDSIMRNRVLPAFAFDIYTGSERMKIRFPGGTVSRLYSVLREQGKDNLDVNLVNDTETSSILVISGKKTGETNRLRFDGETGPLFDIGLLDRGTEKRDETVVQIREAESVASNRLEFLSNRLVLLPGTEAELPLSGKSISVADNSFLDWYSESTPWSKPKEPSVFSLRTNISTNTVTNIGVTLSTNTNTDIRTAVKTLTNEYKSFDIAAMAPVTISDVTVEGGSLLTFYFDRYNVTNSETNFQFRELSNGFTNVAVSVLTDFITDFPPATEETPVTNDGNIVRLEFQDGAARTWNVNPAGSNLQALAFWKGKTPAKFVFANRNTDHSIALSDFRFSKKLSEGGIIPKNPLSLACDADFTLDGVEVKRDKNEVDDLLDGVTLRLLQESQKEVQLSVDYNYDKVQSAVSNWMAAYNQVMTLLYIMTKPDLDRVELADRKEDKLRDGVFSTETSFLALRNRLRTVVQDSYKTELGHELSMLEQIGIYTKKSGSFSPNSDEWQQIQMGVLQMDLEKLRHSLITRFKAVEQLFANNPNGDMVKTSGVAVSTVSSLNLAIGPGSFIERRLVMNNDKTVANQKDIDQKNRDLSEYEVDQRIKYGRMNQAIQSGESERKWLEGQTKQ